MVCDQRVARDLLVRGLSSCCGRTRVVSESNAVVWSNEKRFKLTTNCTLCVFSPPATLEVSTTPTRTSGTVTMPPTQLANESNLGILSDLASQQQPSHSTTASTSPAFDPFHPATETRSLGGVGTGAGVGIDTTMAPAQRIYSPSSRSHARVDTGLEEGEATPLLNTVGLHEEGEGGGTHEVDYNFFGTARGFGTSVPTDQNDAVSSRNGYKGEGKMEDLEEEAQWLVEMDASADMGLAASTRYQEEIVAVMARLSTAMGRTEELQVSLHASSTVYTLN